MNKCYCEYYWPCQHCLTCNPNYKQDLYDEMMKHKKKSFVVMLPPPSPEFEKWMEEKKKEMEDYEKRIYSFFFGYWPF